MLKVDLMVKDLVGQDGHRAGNNLNHPTKVAPIVLEDLHVTIAAREIDQGYNVVFNGDGCEILRRENGNLTVPDKKVGRLFAFTMNVPSKKMNSNLNVVVLWHKRFGHCNLQRVKNISTKKLATGIPIITYNGKHICDACAFAKAPQHPFPSSNSLACFPLEVIHSNVWGPSPVDRKEFIPHEF
ncbi:hypothetical protein NE237_032284 [Protea cynaroides]|uniref:GAG-pre-integrase domain-containing protein n=1 Tax=Protea cynaroides TaxID=273540 RepID=A0A9Q0R3B3_9MAGN|nr:hypothetical protein NE237_032284 [Protea cynaroides]